MKAKTGMAMTQSDWLAWAEARASEAPKVARAFERQAKAVRDVIELKGCTCNPFISMKSGEHGGPSTRDAYITHGFDCAQG